MAEESTDGQEKTEEATPRRQQEARDEGTVARSRELTTMLLLVAASGSLMLSGPTMLRHTGAHMERFFRFTPAAATDHHYIPLAMKTAVLDGVLMLAPFLAVMFVVALVSPLALGGWSLSAKPMAFQWKRLDPIKGLGRVFALRGLMELLKALAKFLLVTIVASAFIWLRLEDIIALGSGDVITKLVEGSLLILQALLVVSASTILLAVVDVPFQLWDHGRKLRMTRQEVKEELKQTEGRPEVKSKIRQLQQQVAMQKMMQDVPDADVIVTNPTHYAVALKYDPDRMGAPRMLARGVDEVALRIRELGHEHRIVQLRTPPLARALYYSTRVGEEVPEGLYLAVAQVLAYVFQLRRRQPGDDLPDVPVDLPIPPEFRHGEEV